jgi:two-component system, OmpR family, phosphate regulon sensor histidine kinase PhoR
MTLTQRLALGSLAMVTVLVLVVLNVIDRGLARRLDEQTADALRREARLIAQSWDARTHADSLADAIGGALGRRVTLIDRAGRVLGDSEFDDGALAALELHHTRPEVAAALASGEGMAQRASRSAGDEELYVAVRAAQGVARVSVSVASLRAAIARARQDVVLAGGVTMLLATILAILFARALTAPIIELRDVAAQLAQGDLSRRPSLSAPGEVGDLAVAVRSLAEQLGARLKAHEAEEALSGALFEALNEGVMAISARRMVLRINDSGRRILGIRQAVPFPFDELPRDRDLRQAVEEALRGRPREGSEIQLLGRTVLLTALPLNDGGAVVALYDLTGLRRLERVRSDFVANVSHELKTPLTVIAGFAETLRDPEVPADKSREFAASIHKNAARMQRLVDDLLDLARIESGTWQPARGSVDLAGVCAEVSATLADAAAAKGVQMETALHPAALRVVADATAVRQILFNLAENALRYTHSGRVTLFSETSSDGTCIGVVDTGIGIPAEHLPRIFERFYRVDPARSREQGGTGLGLSIVKHLTEAHGGRVTAESTVGHGTRIAACFPPDA